MLKRRPPRTGGFSLIELMITIALMAILMMLVLPSIGKWSADARVRAAAESLTNAVRQTQSNAISMGRTSLFALTSDSPPVTTSTPGSGPNWLGVMQPLSGSDNTQGTLIMASSEGSQNSVTVTPVPASATVVCFNSLGRQTTLATNVLSTACTAGDTYFTVSRTGASRSYRVYVYAGGRVRMCDAAKALSNANPDGC